MAYGKLFEDALLFAAEAHREQIRKGSEVPYITHLLAVAAIVGENHGSETEVVAALLHDTIEDTAETEGSISTRFGDEVAWIVAACSDADVSPGEKKPPWKDRKEAYIARLASEPTPVRLVSSADKLHNARSVLADYRLVGEALWTRFKGGRDGTLWYYKSLVVEFGKSQGDTRLTAVVEELSRTVEDLHEAAGEPYPWP